MPILIFVFITMGSGGAASYVHAKVANHNDQRKQDAVFIKAGCSRGKDRIWHCDKDPFKK